MIAIQFSGGKDGLACLYLCRPLLKDATVYFGDTGDIYPHMRRFVFETCERLGANLKVVKPAQDIAAFQAARGLPADIVPVEASAEMQFAMREPRKDLLQSTLSCCGEMLWKPLHRAMIEDRVSTVIRGAKAADSHRGVADGHIDEFGICYRNPIWDWSDKEVFAYLREQGAELPPHYGKANTSFDCLHCTGFLVSAGAAERLAYTRENYPQQWPRIAERLRKVRRVLKDDIAAIAPSLNMVAP